MKRLAGVFVLTVLLASPAQAKDSCASVLCMAGMIQGKGIVKNCGGEVMDYFTIIKFKWTGKISLKKTSKARGKFLGKCADAGSWPKKINNKYGRMLLF